MLADDDMGLYVVSDGMGGHAAGDVASREAVDTVARHIRNHAELLQRIRGGVASDSLLTSLAASAAVEACRSVHRRAAADPELAGMGCTLTVLLVGRRGAAMAHVGDSRLYLRRNDRVRQLSVDHSLAQELVRLGVITSMEAEFVPEGHSLTRAIGIRETVIVDELFIHTRPGDVFLLCSDGLWDYFADEQDLDEFLAEPDLTMSARALVTFANAAGGHDNITALVVHIDRDHADDSDVAPEDIDIDTTMEILRDKGADIPA